MYVYLFMYEFCIVTLNKWKRTKKTNQNAHIKCGMNLFYLQDYCKFIYMGSLYIHIFIILKILKCMYHVSFLVYQTQKVRRVWRYQRGNQNPKIEGQTTQWPKEKEQRDKQWSTKHYTKT